MRIGRGAFASVYRVRQAALDRWVAVKFIYEKNRVKRHELLKEAQTQAKMHAECVPQIFDAFEWRRNICMVMEWIRGISLTTLLERDSSVEERIALAGSFIRSLAVIHGQGFAHRDLKPDNVLIAPDRGLFLVDFGFSKSVNEMQVSSATTVKGTPAYMAPELWSHGSQVDLMRADVYAAGKILVQILSTTGYSSITEPLLNDTPDKRPSSGVDLLLLWENTVTGSGEGTADWHRMAGDLTAETLSEELFGSARNLLYANRSDEAYWLLVESLEENGNNHEALELMSSFQERSRKRLTARHYLTFFLVLLCGVLLAFFAGSRTGSDIGPSIEPVRKKRSQLLGSKDVGPVVTGNLALREDTLRTDKLSGRLIVRNTPENAVLSIDSRPVNTDSVAAGGCYFHWGEHVVAVHDSTGQLLCRYNVMLLPFQTKAMDISVRLGMESDN